MSQIKEDALSNLLGAKMRCVGYLKSYLEQKLNLWLDIVKKSQGCCIVRRRGKSQDNLTNCRMIITVSWDKVIRTHSESNLLNKDDMRKGVLKNLSNAHDNEITCADFSQTSGLLVTGSKDSEVRIW